MFPCVVILCTIHFLLMHLFGSRCQHFKKKKKKQRLSKREIPRQPLTVFRERRYLQAEKFSCIGKEVKDALAPQARKSINRGDKPLVQGIFSSGNHTWDQNILRRLKKKMAGPVHKRRRRLKKETIKEKKEWSLLYQFFGQC